MVRSSPYKVGGGRLNPFCGIVFIIAHSWRGSSLLWARSRVLLKLGSGGCGGPAFHRRAFLGFRRQLLEVLVELLAQRDQQRLAERGEGVAETRVHLFQRTAKLDLVFSHVQQRGLNDGFRLLEPGDFLSRVNAVFLEVVDALLESGYLLFEFAGRGFRLSLAVDPIPGRLPQPIGRALPRFLDGADHLGVHADRQLFHQIRMLRLHVN